MDKKISLSLLKTMLRIRCFEETAEEAFRNLLIPGLVHTYIGEEAIAAGVCENLRRDDYIISTHRAHGHSLAKGMSPKKLMAELLGKKTGCCGGIGGSMHSTDLENGILFSTAIVGGGIPISVGAGFSVKYSNTDQVVICFFGDGASNTGSFHESLNLASVWKLPILFVCENNLYAISVNTKKSTSVENISERASSYNLQGKSVDGNNAIVVYETASEFVKNVREGKGPALLECKTYRWKGHHLLDLAKYRSEEETEYWRKKCPINRLKIKLIDEDILTETEFQKMNRKIQNEINEALEFAKSSPSPTPDALHKYVFAPESMKYYNSNETERKITFSEALNEALREEMHKDDRVFILGEDVGNYGGVFTVTKGLINEFGPERVRDTPISETAILGVAIGSAITGLKPIAEIMYMDFLNVCMDQLVNHAPKLYFMTAGQLKSPLVIRTQSSLGRFTGAQHSQFFPCWFMHVPGLKVAIPSTPYDAKGLLKTAIQGENPVLFIEFGALYRTKGLVPEAQYNIPFGKGDVKKEGTDITLIAISSMVDKALNVANRLSEEGISIEIIDPRTLVPLDKDIIINSIKKTHRLIIAEESCKTAGVGAEISSMVVEEAFDYLDAPIVRVGAPNTPVPFSPVLQEDFIPSEQDLVAIITKLLK